MRCVLHLANYRTVMDPNETSSPTAAEVITSYGLSEHAAAYTSPFRVTDHDDFIRQIDDIDDISLAEEVIEGNIFVRLFAESGVWPGTGNLAGIISSNLPEGEVAVLIENTIESPLKSDVRLTAITHTGATLETDLDDMVTNLQDSARVLLNSEPTA